MLRKDVVVIPNGVDFEKFKFQETNSKFLEKQKRILFIGDFKWMQNKDAASFIIKEIWPLISSKKDVKLWIVGRNIPASMKNLTSDKRIAFDDNNKEETEDIYKKSFLLLAPIRVGAGTSYKVLEGMATGTAVVTTSLGIEGLEAKNNMHVLASNDAKTLASDVQKLLTDKALYGKLTNNARDFVQKNYNWEEITKRLEEVYLSTRKYD
jgi:glycosyltransferase involved in cell wall biosynthesis